MRKLIRSLPGKTLLFILIDLSVIAAFVCLMGSLHMGGRLSLWDRPYEILVTPLWPAGFFASLILALCFFMMLMCSAGRRNGTEELVKGPLFKCPFDLLFMAYTVSGLLFWGPVLDEGLIGRNEPWEQVLLASGFLLFPNLGLGLCVSAAARVKDRSFLKGTAIAWLFRLLLRFLKWLWRELLVFGRALLSFLRSLPLVWKTLLFITAAGTLQILAFWAWEYYYPYLVLSIFLIDLVISLYVLYNAVCLKKLQKGGEALAAGDLSYHTDTRGMFWDLKKHGENLNSIAGGMSIAVEERLKSERMKTELITNVSHDIKTPLTSIISYSSLIANEPCDNANVRSYSEVLLRQSEKLKRLIDDLVEASKASTGNLEVAPVPCSAPVFLSQAAGEYEERLRQAGLTLVTRQPEEDLTILADGRRMQRIFDNLMGNILKYAQPGTRVYLSLERIGRQAVFTFRNTSKDALDISPDELLERFTRGDASRSTEGNGLGLSIARSLAELQGGTLQIFIDGDLFKALLAFPLITD